MRIIVATLVIVVAAAGVCFAADRGGIGHPTGRLGNRFFTHPRAADVYVQNGQYRRSLHRRRKPSTSPRVYRRDKIYISDQTQAVRRVFKRDEVVTMANLDGVLVAGPRKGTKNAQ